MLKDSFNTDQKAQTPYELVFDMHELTDKSFAVNSPMCSKIYVDYIVAVLNLYGNLCLSSNQKSIKAIQETGLNETHLILCMAQDKRELKIHERLKQMYTYLARVLYVENDPISIGIDNKKRCYVW